MKTYLYTMDEEVNEEDEFWISIERLKSCYWPESCVSGMTLENLAKYKPVEHRRMFKLDQEKEYYFGRVLFFLEKLNKNEELDPVVINTPGPDSDCFVEMDGISRFIAASLKGCSHICALFTYNSSQDVINWLCEYTDERPAGLSDMFT
jgi:hypothetical protein